ncbi:MAG: AmmeMemoRadiSam system protein B [Armatimonadetes bacterium]|nr:AmmeMemoRadiSam system protein B [Armatimonadota bacterium]
MPTRYPAVAGVFYEAAPEALRAQVRRSFLAKPGPGAFPAVNPGGPRRILGLVCPHAGLIYSGFAAAHAYARLAQDGPLDVAVILCPNHHGMGAVNAIWARGAWQTPLGSVAIAEDVAAAICERYPRIVPDALAHAREHSAEVQLPFLQVLYGDAVSVVPVAMQHYDLAESLALGEAIAGALEGRNAVVIASSDFSHYEPAAHARAQDACALEAIERLDPGALFARVHERGITTCGCGPVATMIAAARLLGARRAEVLAYTTSGDITGDFERVVGYAAVAVSR